jgi:hypothetical protein
MEVEAKTGFSINFNLTLRGGCAVNRPFVVSSVSLTIQHARNLASKKSRKP